jgi:hypothetical protein
MSEAGCRTENVYVPGTSLQEPVLEVLLQVVLPLYSLKPSSFLVAAVGDFDKPLSVLY